MGSEAENEYVFPSTDGRSDRGNEQDNGRLPQSLYPGWSGKMGRDADHGGVRYEQCREFVHRRDALLPELWQTSRDSEHLGIRQSAGTSEHTS